MHKIFIWSRGADGSTEGLNLMRQELDNGAIIVNVANTERDIIYIIKLPSA